MAIGTLTSTTIAARYKSLLKITGTGNDELHATTLKLIEDGDGNNSCLQLAQNRAEIVPVANHANAFEVSQTDGTQIFNIASDTPALIVNAATVTLTQDTDFVTSGGVNGMSIDGTTFSVDGSNNRIGIGTAAPGYLLEMSSAAATSNVPTLAITNLSTTAAHVGGNLYFRRGDPDANLGDDILLGEIVWFGQDNSDDAWIDAGRIKCTTDGTPGTNDMPADLSFWTNDGVNSAEQRMVINAAGKVGIGNAAPGQELHVGDNTSGANVYIQMSTNTDAKAGLMFSVNNSALWVLENDASDDLRVYDYSDTSEASHIGPGDNDWQAGSDERIKKDIVNIGSVLNKVNALRPITWKRKYGKLDKTYPGLVAQEVIPQFPLVVSGSVDSFQETTDDQDNLSYTGGLSIGYSNFVPYLIKAVQELSAKVTALENA